MLYDVVALGELLIDFTGSEASSQGNPVFEANPGGAPCNVLSILVNHGKSCAFIGKIGKDILGGFLKDTIRDIGIGTSGLIEDENANTTLAFVHTAPDGDRTFSFFRNPGADTQLTPEDVDLTLIENCRLFHFGSLSLTHEPVRSATQKAVAYAREKKKLISFDPNLRPPLWADLEEARRQMRWGCCQCNVIKLSEEELFFITDMEQEADIDKSLPVFRNMFPGIELIFVTKGKDGAECYYKDYVVKRPAVTGLTVIETTGAGDCFFGSCLAYLLDHPGEALTKQQLSEMLEYAIAASGLVTTKKGALRSMPMPKEVEQLLQSQR